VGELRQAEVQDFDLSAARDEDVGRLDVAMHDVARMRGLERLGDLDAVVEQLIHRERLAVDAAPQRLAIEEFHDEERQVAVLADVVDAQMCG
jgi:hypothetical protein